MEQETGFEPGYSPEKITRFAGQKETSEEDQARQKALDYFHDNQSFLTAYAQDATFKVEPGGFTDANGNYIGFAIDLENGILFSDPRFFTEKGYSPQKAMVGHLHELEQNHGCDLKAGLRREEFLVIGLRSLLLLCH